MNFFPKTFTRILDEPIIKSNLKKEFPLGELKLLVKVSEIFFALFFYYKFDSNRRIR